MKRWRRTRRWTHAWRCASALPTRRPGGSPRATTSCSCSASASEYTPRRVVTYLLTLFVPKTLLFFFRHGLGDTYNKLFCDPKLPFADCARKWYATHKGSSSASKTASASASSTTMTTSESQKVSSDEEDRSIHETKMSLRRSKRTNPERDDDDTDALSELETLAKLGRIEESLSPEYWFSERALETRLHHIAHAVQTSEWPSASATPKEARGAHDAKHAQKRHIAIDVETERAKLHALLSSPAAAHSTGRDPLRDDASSDSGSRRSTPAPPPAHQRVAPSPAPSPAAAAPVDLSAPLDLSEVQDFSMGRRTPVATDLASSAATPPRSRLDDTLSRLMKRKNVVRVSFDKILCYSR